MDLLRRIPETLIVTVGLVSTRNKPCYQWLISSHTAGWVTSNALLTMDALTKVVGPPL